MNPEVKRYPRSVPMVGQSKAGGEVSSEAFPQALWQLAKSRGYPSQLNLAQVFGFRGNSSVSAWYHGKRVPSPEYFGAMLRLFKPTDEESEMLVEPYCQLLAKGYDTRVERSFKAGKKHRKPPETLLGQAIETISGNHQFTLREWSRRVGFSVTTVSKLRRGMSGSIDTLAEFLEKSSSNLELTEEEAVALADGIAEMVKKMVEQGKGQNLCASRIRSLQFQVPCLNYLPVDIAVELNLSRERIRQIREKLGIENVILTEDDRRRIINYQKEDHRKASSRRA